MIDNKFKEAIRNELQDMVDTARAVRGDAFADFMGFVGNANSVVKMYAMAMSGNAMVNDEQHAMLGDLFCTTVTSLCKDYGDVLELSEEMRSEALDMVTTIEKKIHQRVSEALKGDGDEQS